MSTRLEVDAPVFEPTGEFSELFEDRPATDQPSREWFRIACPLREAIVAIAGNAVESIRQLRDLGHEAVSGSFTEKFKQESHSQQVLMTAVGGQTFPEAYQVYNRQYLNNGRPTYVYSNSLFVSGRHGIQVPTLHEIATYADAQRCAVIHHITDGYSEHLGPKQLASLTDFDLMTQRRFAVYRNLLKPDSQLIVAGESLGGMFAYAIAASQESEAELSHHPIWVKKLIAIASAGHNPYSKRDALKHLSQLGDEPRQLNNYLRGDEASVLEKVQRLFELGGTLPLNVQQVLASALIAKAILDSPLVGVESKVPAYTFVVDQVYGEDKVTQPHLRAANWQRATQHPEGQRVLYLVPGLSHLALLSVGRLTTKAHLGPESDEPLFDLSLVA